MALVSPGVGAVGANDPVEFTANAWVNFGRTPMSVGCWFRFADYATAAGSGHYDMPLVFKVPSANAPPTSGWGLNLTFAGVGAYEFEFDVNGYATQGSFLFFATVSDNNWHHVLCSYKNSTTGDLPVIYQDGAALAWDSVDSTTPGGSFTADPGNPLVLGCKTYTNSPATMNGAIAHAAVWSDMLTPIEAQLLASGVPPQLIRSDALVFYCPCLGDATQALDLGRARLGIASVTGAWESADDPRGSLLPGRGDVPVAFSPLLQALPYRRPNQALYRR